MLSISLFCQSEKKRKTLAQVLASVCGTNTQAMVDQKWSIKHCVTSYCVVSSTQTTREKLEISNVKNRNDGKCRNNN